MGSKPSKEATNYNDDHDHGQLPSGDQGQRPILELLRPECFRANNHKVVNNNKKKKKTQLHPLEREDTTSESKTSLTLKDWLLSTPGSKPDSFSEGELYVLKKKNLHRRVTSPSRTRPARARPDSCHKSGGDEDRSFSLERLVMLDRARDLEDEYSFRVSSLKVSSSSSIPKKGQSGKQMKRVTFKSPRESDVVVFYSPRPL